MAQPENTLQKWLDGQMSLGAAASWDKDEIRIISEVAYSLAQQGRNLEAVVLFEGLLAIAPATAYFQAALGALFLRMKNFPKAIEHLDAALNLEPNDILSLVNRGEAQLKNDKITESRKDLEKALQIAERLSIKQSDINDETILTVKRARVLLRAYQSQK